MLRARATHSASLRAVTTNCHRETTWRIRVGETLTGGNKTGLSIDRKKPIAIIPDKKIVYRYNLDKNFLYRLIILPKNFPIDRVDKLVQSIKGPSIKIFRFDTITIKIFSIDRLDTII